MMDHNLTLAFAEGNSRALSLELVFFERPAGRAMVKVKGIIFEEDNPGLERRLNLLVQSDIRELLVYWVDLEFLDSLGHGSFIRFQGRMKRLGRRVVFVIPPGGNVDRTLRALGSLSLLPNAPDLGTAIRILDAAPTADGPQADDLGELLPVDEEPAPSSGASPVGKPGFILDLDGTLLDGQRVLNNAVTFFQHLAKRQLEFVVMTNSVQSPAVIRERLAAAGLEVPAARIFNPLVVMGRLLQARGYERVRLIGSKAELEQFNWMDSRQDYQAVCLLDFERDNLGYSVLQEIYEALEAGLPIMAASGSEYYLHKGRRRLDTGAFVGLLERVSGRTIEVVGKPSSEYFGVVRAAVGAASSILVVGDDRQTDVAGGRAAGLKTCLVRTGKYRPGDEDLCRPDHFTDNLMTLLDL